MLHTSLGLTDIICVRPSDPHKSRHMCTRHPVTHATHMHPLVQLVKTSLTFSRDGEILGSGYDEVDGAYQINEGRWSAHSPGARVAWIESYQNPPFCREFEGAPFEVALRGQVRPDGTILAIWASSRGIGGTVELLPPV